jgi:hypothetical protein
MNGSKWNVNRFWKRLAKDRSLSLIRGQADISDECDGGVDGDGESNDDASI